MIMFLNMFYKYSLSKLALFLLFVKILKLLRYNYLNINFFY